MESTVQAPAPVTGQADNGLAATQTTGTAPEAASGQASNVQPQDGTRTSETAPVAAGDDSFFDPSELPSELTPAYKKMQAAYTKKMQAIATERQKIEAYNRFNADPVGNMQALARQYGYQLSRADAAAAIAQQQGQQPAQDWTPQTWTEVIDRAKQEAVQEFRQQLAPLLQNVQQMRAHSIEQKLDMIDSNWREYEDNMRETLKRHPTLVDDEAMLYRVSVPQEVLESRATQKALKQFEAKKQAAKVAEKSTANANVSAPRKIDSFQDAVAYAKELQARGGQ